MSATFWFLILIIQPYLYSRSKMKYHRTIGIIGFLFAGFVAASALSVIRGHIKDLNPEADSFIYAYRYSLSLTDFIYIAGFLFAIVMGIIHRKKIEKHSRWLISSIFWVFSPATDRFSNLIFSSLLDENANWYTFKIEFWISHIFIISILLLLLIIDFRKGNKYWYPYGIILLTHIITPILLIEMADSEGLARWFEFMYR